MRNTFLAVAAAIAVFAGPSAIMAQFPVQGRPDDHPAIEGANGPALAPSGAAGRPIMPQALQQPEHDRHDNLHNLSSVAHSSHIFNLHGKERLTGVPPTRFTVAEPAFNPTATRCFGSACEFAPALRTSESAVGLVASCLGKLKAILVGIGGALAAIFGVRSGKDKNESESNDRRRELY
jgi:hypothetical protein